MDVTGVSTTRLENDDGTTEDAMMLLTVGALACAVLGPGAAGRPALPDEAQVDLRPEGAVHEWVVLGPFANPRDVKGNPREAFDADLLAALGGEAKARIEEGTEVEVAGPDGATTRLKAQAVRLPSPVLDFRPLYTDSDNRLAYAYTEVTASCDGEALILLGSDDGAKVWVNGEKAFEIFPPTGRGLTARSDRFTAKLHAGVNRVLVKVENGTGDWKLQLEAYGTEAAKKLEAEIAFVQRTRELQDQPVVPAGGWALYLFGESEGFPRIIWRDVERVRELAGDIPLTVRWFDGDLNEVTKPKGPGRYAALVEGRLRDGTPLRRGIAFYCVPDGSDLLWRDYSVKMGFPGVPFDAKTWSAHEAAVDRWIGGLTASALANTEGGAIFLSWLDEVTKSGAPASAMEAPDVRNDDYHLRLKLKLAGRDKDLHPLAAPTTRAGGPAPVLRTGTPAEAGVKPGAKASIDAACQRWAEESGEPFTVLVARHGVIVTHAAFGKTEDGKPLGLDFRNEVASITKALTGMLFSRFVDQGLVAIDDPVGNYLPGYPTKGKYALTFRHLFTHTTGLEGHANWGGIHNPYLDNVILDGLPALKPGEVHIYNGMGYDLAGKAMEYIAGANVARLMNDGLFAPLGLTDVPPVYDLAFSAQLTAYDLGVLAQCMANRGSYGGKQLLSEETFAKTLPVQLKQYWPALDVEWGIGLTPYRERREGADAKDPSSLLLGDNVVGHGSATSCVLRVALDKDVTVAMIRRTAGDKYDEHLRDVLTAVSDALL
jgi:CubicO group peptidase (beta-lactamase class C family)